jgi:GTP cyclohydrolase I
LDELLNREVFTEEADEMVLVRDIDIFSYCEHHILPVIGRVQVAYIPNGKVIGLSKMPVFVKCIQDVCKYKNV